MITLRSRSSFASLALALLVGVAFGLAATPGLVGAQTATPAPATPPAATPAPGADAGGGGVATAVVLIVALLVVVGVAVKLFDLKRKREAEGVHVQSQIADALLREEALFGLPITPTAHVPFLKGSPVTVVVDGEVPDAETREAVLRIVRREAESIRPDVRIEDRLTTGAEARVA
jgi:hypothetical protein